ncbi:anti-sigma factor family protein [Microbulbifer elongatus]|uniref:anti-sigma factor family protein n=1 Tax=Microbulbifer elongatus TaxID=86173 RepID=UPI001E34B812|nr:zf-HC2 domain-containing protein [Microbulbifer elongatus]
MALHSGENPENPVSAEDLSAFADGALPPRRARQVARHLRHYPEAAQQVFDIWCIENAALQQLNSTGGDSDRVRNGAKPFARSGDARNSGRVLPWISGAAAGVLLVLGVCVLSLEQTRPEAPPTAVADTVHPSRLESVTERQTGAALVPVDTVAIEMIRPDLELSSQQIADEMPAGKSADRAGGTAPSGNHLLPEKLQGAVGNARLNFRAEDGTTLILNTYPMQTSAQMTLDGRVPEEVIGKNLAAGNRVHWVHSETLFVLSGNIDAAGLFRVALGLRAEPPASGRVFGPGASESIREQGTSGSLNTNGLEVAPGFSKM